MFELLPFELLPFELFGEVSHFLSSKDFLNLTQTCQKCRKLLFEKHVMIGKEFKLKETQEVLEIFRTLPWKVYHLDLNGNLNVKDEDFKLLRGIKTLNMSRCFQPWITDDCLFHLKGIQKLDISHCHQITPDATFFLQTVPSLTADACSVPLREKLKRLGIRSCFLCDDLNCKNCWEHLFDMGCE